MTSRQIFSLQQFQQILKMVTMPVSKNASPRCLGTATIRKHRDTIAKCLHISKALPAHNYIFTTFALFLQPPHSQSVFLRGKKYHDRQIRERGCLFFQSVFFTFFLLFLQGCSMYKPYRDLLHAFQYLLPFFDALAEMMRNQHAISTNRNCMALL